MARLKRNEKRSSQHLTIRKFLTLISKGYKIAKRFSMKKKVSEHRSRITKSKIHYLYYQREDCKRFWPCPNKLQYPLAGIVIISALYLSIISAQLLMINSLLNWSEPFTNCRRDAAFSTSSQSSRTAFLSFEPRLCSSE